MEVVMTYESRRLAGILLIILPTVMFGGVSLLSLLIGDPTYMQNSLRQDLWRAGHAHAGVWLILALVVLRYVDEANLSDSMKWLVRSSVPVAAILVPAAFFLSVLSPNATAPNGLIYLAYVGAVLLAVGVLVLGVGPSGARHKAPRSGMGIFDRSSGHVRPFVSPRPQTRPLRRNDTRKARRSRRSAGLREALQQDLPMQASLTSGLAPNS